MKPLPAEDAAELTREDRRVSGSAQAAPSVADPVLRPEEPEERSVFAEADPAEDASGELYKRSTGRRQGRLAYSTPRLGSAEFWLAC